jgi:hypothetical protein
MASTFLGRDGLRLRFDGVGRRVLATAGGATRRRMRPGERSPERISRRDAPRRAVVRAAGLAPLVLLLAGGPTAALEPTRAKPSDAAGAAARSAASPQPARTPEAAPSAAAAPAPTLPDGSDPSATGPPNVLLLSFDTLRADHVPLSGDETPTPNLQALSRQGTAFARAYAHTATTAPSHATLMTSLHPTTHGVTKNGVKLGPENETLAEILHARGYRTVAFVAALPLWPSYGWSQGFDEYFASNATPKKKTEGRFCTSSPLPRSAERCRGKPCQPFADAYAAEVRWVDAQAGRVLGWLDENGLTDDTLVIAVADHGEAFDEHGYWVTRSTSTRSSFAYRSCCAGRDACPPDASCRSRSASSTSCRPSSISSASTRALGRCRDEASPQRPRARPLRPQARRSSSSASTTSRGGSPATTSRVRSAGSSTAAGSTPRHPRRTGARSTT